MPTIISGDELLGYDEIGATATPMSRGRQLASLPGGVGKQFLRQSQPTRAREIVMGIDSVATIAAAATAIVQGQPQIVFRPDRIVIPATIAGSFLINDLKVGKNSQFVNGTAVPAEAFTQGAFGVRLKMDTLQISQTVAFTVTNVSLGALRFNAALIGPAVE